MRPVPTVTTEPFRRSTPVDIVERRAKSSQSSTGRNPPPPTDEILDRCLSRPIDSEIFHFCQLSRRRSRWSPRKRRESKGSATFTNNNISVVHMIDTLFLDVHIRGWPIEKIKIIYTRFLAEGWVGKFVENLVNPRVSPRCRGRGAYNSWPNKRGHEEDRNSQWRAQKWQRSWTNQPPRFARDDVFIGGTVPFPSLK